MPRLAFKFVRLSRTAASLELIWFHDCGLCSMPVVLRGLSTLTGGNMNYSLPRVSSRDCSAAPLQLFFPWPPGVSGQECTDQHSANDSWGGLWSSPELSVQLFTLEYSALQNGSRFHPTPANSEPCFWTEQNLLALCGSSLPAQQPGNSL